MLPFIGRECTTDRKIGQGKKGTALSRYRQDSGISPIPESTQHIKE